MKSIKFFFVAAIAAMAAACSGKPETTASTTLETIFSRKSVRQYTDQPVEAKTLETLVKAAMAAPSGMNVQPWHFVVITDDDVKKAVDGSPRGGMISSAPAVIVVCGETTIMRKPVDSDEEVEIVNSLWTADCGAATENLLLAAEALGLGAVWTACWPFEERMSQVKAALGLPENVSPYAVVPVGYPAGDDKSKDKWKPERVHQNKW